MIYLKKANYEDVNQEYMFIRDTPENENGFMNNYSNISFEDFKLIALPKMIAQSEGRDLPIGYVPQTTFFLWDNQTIVGLFRVRHYLNDALRNGAGHIGYGIKKEYRGKRFASIGLGLVIEEAKKIILEDEIYMSVHIDNNPSLRAQLKCGAIIHHSDELEYYTRIKIN